MKVKCETNSFGSGIVLVFCGLSPSSVLVQYYDRIDIYRLISVSFCIVPALVTTLYCQIVLIGIPVSTLL